MCVPIGRLALAVHPDRKGWICIYTVRVCLILLIAVVAEWFCAFHWIDGVMELMVIFSGLISLWFCMSDHGVQPMSPLCLGVFIFSCWLWAIIRVIMFYAAPSKALGAESIADWQRIVLQAALWNDVVIYLVMLVALYVLYKHLRALVDDLLDHGGGGAGGDDQQQPILVSSGGGGGGSVGGSAYRAGASRGGAAAQPTSSQSDWRSSKGYRLDQ